MDFRSGLIVNADIGEGISGSPAEILPNRDAVRSVIRKTTSRNRQQEGLMLGVK